MKQVPRSRLEDIRKRFLEVGLEALNTEEMLELLLYYVSPRADNYARAEAILTKYDSLRNVLSSSVNQLKTVGGVNESTALFLALVGQTGRQMFLESMEGRPGAFASIPDIGRYFMELVRGQPREAFYELCLSGDTFINCRVISEVGQELIRSSVEGALESAADNVAICHRQAGGLAALSEDDRALSRRFRDAMDVIRVSFRDYIVVADDDFVSLTETDSKKRPKKKGVIIGYAPF
ncbi:MAG: hypothetical protein IJR48_04340 [Oscillibacter sp.]|nr:hypothetical protein [Oscillibacter sp.]MBQ9617574.1 hypothetical protein [Oscillibacter sp.]